MAIQQLKSFKILLIGDSCLDIYHYGTCERISPEAPVPIFTEKSIKVMEGMSLNVKHNLKQLNLEVYHITHEQKIEKHRYIAEPYSQQLLRVDKNDEVINEQAKICSIPKHKFSAIIISDYNKGFINNEFLSAISYYCLDNKLPLFIDTKKTDLSKVKNAFVKINLNEEKKLTQISSSCKLIVTLGEKGAKYDNKIYSCDPVDVYDVCGAGDVFLAALVAYYLNSTNIERSIKFANKCASKAVCNFGTYILSASDIEQVLSINRNVLNT